MNTVKTQQCNILIADDERGVAISVSIVLRRSGCKVDVVDDGEPALDKIGKSPGHYHLLITDHSMKKMNGLELVRQLKLLHFPGKILVLSGCLDRKTEETYHLLGVDKIMEKPFDPDVLRSVVKELALSHVQSSLQQESSLIAS